MKNREKEREKKKREGGRGRKRKRGSNRVVVEIKETLKNAFC